MTRPGQPLQLSCEASDGRDALRLIAGVQAEYVERYGAPDEDPFDPADFRPPRGLFVVGRVAGEPVASGGYRRSGDEAELKRMYVVPEQRGRGHARAVLAELERAARDAGCMRVRLTTGVRQPEAMALYESSGYVAVEPFGHYASSPAVRCYAKELVSGRG